MLRVKVKFLKCRFLWNICSVLEVLAFTSFLFIPANVLYTFVSCCTNFESHSGRKYWKCLNNLQFSSYFVRSGEEQPSQRHVYVYNLKTAGSKCLTCDMNTSRGVCKYAAASFSKTFRYVTKVCQGPGPFVVEIQNTKNVK